MTVQKRISRHFKVWVKLLVKCLNSLTMNDVSSIIYFFSLACVCIDRFISIVIVKNTSGPRYVVGCRNTVDKEKLKQGARVALDMTTLTIMRILPREVDPLVYNMSMEDPGNISFAGIGGLGEQIRELREVSLWMKRERERDTR